MPTTWEDILKARRVTNELLRQRRAGAAEQHNSEGGSVDELAEARERIKESREKIQKVAG